jgi:nitroreductase/NAD-dependent dihydropyrimidine dehydrogenase PreA subunit
LPTGNTFNLETCTRCGLCAEVCPMKIIRKDDTAGMIFRADRIEFCFKCGQCMAVCPAKSINVDGLSYSDDFGELPDDSFIEDAFMNMIATRRAIRNFKDKPVPKEMLEKIVDAITYAPPGFPPLKTEIVVVQDTKIIRQALPHMIELFDSLMKAMDNPFSRFFVKRRVDDATYRVMKNHVVPLMKMRLPGLKDGTEDTITRYAPAMIIFHANRDAENYRQDIYIALTYGFLAAHALGLGGSAMELIPPAIERNKELRKLFSIPDSNEVVASMILGFPKYKYQRTIRRKLKGVTWI